MSGFSTYLAQQAITTFVVGKTCYLALMITDPTDNNIGTEASAGWYGRVLIPSWNAPVGTGTSTSNSTQLSFNAVTGSAVSVLYWALYDAATAGNLLYSGAIYPPTPPALVATIAKVLSVDDVFVVNAGALVIDFQ